MKNVVIEETDTTPRVDFDFAKGLFEFKGLSIPEDTQGFYNPVVQTLDQYAQNPTAKKHHLTFTFLYINTSTSAMISRILKIFETIQAKGFKVNVVWSFESDDEDMKDLGTYFSSFTNLPFQFIPHEEIV